MKERITITISNDLIKQVDDLIDEINIKNRSHAIELLITKGLSKQNINRAVLLAGGNEKIGLGKSKIYTACAPLRKKPIIEHIIFSLVKHGINKFLIVGKKLCLKEIKESLKNENINAEIDYLEEPNSMGTAGALKLASEFITGPTVVCNTNALFQIDINEMFNSHKNSDSLVTIALTTETDVRKFGVVLLNGNKIFSFEEKPQRKVPSNLINAGCYIIEPEALDLIPEGFSKMEIDLFPKLAKQEKLSGFVFYGKWMRVDDLEDLEEAETNW